MGLAIMGTGVAEGEDRAMQAANRAISSPLLEDASVRGARGVIINVTGGTDISLTEVSEASSIIQEAAHEDANIIFGAVVDPMMAGTIKITVIATGFDKVDALPRGSDRRTPADLNHYQRDGVWQAPVVHATTANAPSMTISRRQALDLQPPSFSLDEHLATGTDDTSPLDVPAFLTNRGHQ